MSTGRSLNGAVALVRKVVVVAIIMAYPFYFRDRETWFSHSVQVQRSGQGACACQMMGGALHAREPNRSRYDGVLLFCFLPRALRNLRGRELYCFGLDMNRLSYQESHATKFIGQFHGLRERGVQPANSRILAIQLSRWKRIKTTLVIPRAATRLHREPVMYTLYSALCPQFSVIMFEGLMS